VVARIATTTRRTGRLSRTAMPSKQRFAGYQPNAADVKASSGPSIIPRLFRDFLGENRTYQCTQWNAIPDKPFFGNEPCYLLSDEGSAQIPIR